MPIPVKTKPRFRCRFCLSFTATLPTVERHEGFCYYNPDRVCNACQNTGTIVHEYDQSEFPCHYCAKENKEATASVRASKL